MLAKSRTVFFGAFLVVWLIPSSVAVVVDDDGDDDYQNSELASIENCPTNDHPQLDHLIKTLGRTEVKWWSKAARMARLLAPKDFNKEWVVTSNNSTTDDVTGQLLDISNASDYNASANLCQCCFKHPILAKVGARLAQHLVPSWAEFIDTNIDNIIEAMKSQPDHDAQHILNHSNNLSSRKLSSVALIAEDHVDSSDDYYSGEWLVPIPNVVSNAFNSAKNSVSNAVTDATKAVSDFVAPATQFVGIVGKPIPCLVNVVMIVLDVISIIIPVRGAVNAGALSGTLNPKMLADMGKTAGKAKDFCVAFKAASGTFTAAEKFAGAKQVALFVLSIYTRAKDIFTGAIDQYKNTLSLFDGALMIVKMLAQFVVWFASGLAALVASIVLALANLVTDFYKFFVTDKCLG